MQKMDFLQIQHLPHVAKEIIFLGFCPNYVKSSTIVVWGWKGTISHDVFTGH